MRSGGGVLGIAFKVAHHLIVWQWAHPVSQAYINLGVREHAFVSTAGERHITVQYIA